MQQLVMAAAGACFYRFPHAELGVWLPGPSLGAQWRRAVAQREGAPNRAGDDPRAPPLELDRATWVYLAPRANLATVFSTADTTDYAMKLHALMHTCGLCVRPGLVVGYVQQKHLQDQAELAARRSASASAVPETPVAPAQRTGAVAPLSRLLDRVMTRGAAAEGKEEASLTGAAPRAPGRGGLRRAPKPSESPTTTMTVASSSSSSSAAPMQLDPLTGGSADPALLQQFIAAMS